MLNSCVIVNITSIDYDEPMKSVVLSVLISIIEHMLRSQINYIDPEYLDTVYDTETEFLSGWLNIVGLDSFRSYVESYVCEIIEDPLNYLSIASIADSGLIVKDFSYVYNTDKQIYLGVNFS